MRSAHVLPAFISTFSGTAMMVGKIKVKDKDGKDVEKEVWEVLVLEPENEDYRVRHRADDAVAKPDKLPRIMAGRGTERRSAEDRNRLSGDCHTDL